MHLSTLKGRTCQGSCWNYRIRDFRYAEHLNETRIEHISASSWRCNLNINSDKLGVTWKKTVVVEKQIIMFKLLIKLSHIFQISLDIISDFHRNRSNY